MILNSSRSSKISKIAPTSTPNKKWISSSILTKSQDSFLTSSKTPRSCKICSRTHPTLPPGKAHQYQPEGKTSKEILKATTRGKVQCSTVSFPKLINTALFPANTTTGTKIVYKVILVVIKLIIALIYMTKDTQECLSPSTTLDTKPTQASPPCPIHSQHLCITMEVEACPECRWGQVRTLPILPT